LASTRSTPKTPPLDFDGDELDNLGEFMAGTNPFDFDSDGDQLSDGEEVNDHGSDPTLFDTDDGGRSDFDEVIWDLTDPTDPADDVAHTGFFYNLTDAGGFLWDIESLGWINNGSINAYDRGMRLSVDGSQFPGFNQGVLRLADREVRIGPWLYDGDRQGLRVWRRVYVPADDVFARHVEEFENPTGEDREITVRIFTDLGAPITVIATSNGDVSLTPADDWILNDDADAAGSPAVLTLFSDDRAVEQPTLATYSADDLNYEWRITVPAGGRAWVMHFSAQHANRADALANVERIIRLQGRALEGIPRADRDLVVNLRAHPDADGDDLDDLTEAELGTDPQDPDTDDDGAGDGWEVEYGFDPLQPGDGALDPDNDGLDNAAEFDFGSHPREADIDRDNLTDAGELLAGTDPNDPDTDDDLLFDGDEVNIYGTRPDREDTDAGGTDDASKCSSTSPTRSTRSMTSTRPAPARSMAASASPTSARPASRDRPPTTARASATGSSPTPSSPRSPRTAGCAPMATITPWPSASTRPAAATSATPRSPALATSACGTAATTRTTAAARSPASTMASAPARSAPQPSIDRATVTFANDYPDRRLTISWYDHVCNEQATAIVNAGDEITLDTFIGHQWRVRDADSGELLDTVTIRVVDRRYAYPNPVRAELYLCGGSGLDVNILLEPGDPFDPPELPERVRPHRRRASHVRQPQRCHRWQRPGVARIPRRRWHHRHRVQHQRRCLQRRLWRQLRASGGFTGGCSDRVDPAERFNNDDPFWQANNDIAPNPNTGCGYDLRNMPGIVPLGGWGGGSVSLGYIDVGQGRLWLVDLDWQDAGGAGPEYAPSIQLLRYMIFNRR
jgi:hypothetical protein